ncbi:MAG: hypothetical protein AAF950_17250 [Pseudomonadota bacterium]
MGKAKTFEGDACDVCGCTERYQKSKGCVACFRKSREIASKKAVTSKVAAPSPLKRPKDWPQFLTESGDTIPADPIAVALGL